MNDSYSEVRRVRHAMSASVAHEIRKLFVFASRKRWALAGINEMSEPRNDNEADLPRLSNRWVHKRSLAVVSCFVILPWILIAIPGTDGVRVFG